MTETRIEVFDDVLHPAGGHAVIRLNGVVATPAEPTFRIEPIDEGLATDGWPTGVLKPMLVRTTDAGIELVAGPDITEKSLLLPGTPVTIVVPALNLSQDILWPNVRPITKQAVRIRVAAAPSEARATPDVVATLPEKQEQKPAAEEAQGFDADAGAKRLAERLASAARAREVRSQQQTDDVIGAVKTTKTGAEAASSSSDAAKTPKPATPTPVAPPPVAAAVTAPTPQKIPPKAAPASPAASPSPPSSRSSPVASTPAMPQPRAKSRVLAFAMGIAFGALLATAGLVMLDMVPPVAVTSAPADAPVQPAASPPPVVAAPAPAPEPVPAMPAAIPQTVPPIHQAEPPKPPKPQSLAGAFAKGAISPLGQTTSGVDVDTALGLADQYRRGAAAGRNPEEAAFWARVAIAQALDSDRMRWALTQAGTGYARQSPPDFARARLIWEIAADLGDPIALCFLGDLYEQGLGVPAERSAALDLALKAKKAGGCRGIDETIERLQR